MRIIETTIFTRRLKSLLGDENYRNLQNQLVDHPNSRQIIRGRGGIRKYRWLWSGRGKSDGVRIIYYLIKSEETILMLLIYAKKEQDDLTPEQLRFLKNVVESEFK